MSDIHDTIIARASAPGGALRGILRISGSLALSLVKTIAESPLVLTRERSSHCVNTRIVLPNSHLTLPAVMLIWQEGHSYTGNETVEIHTLGSPVLLDTVTAALLAASDSVRLAQPGEFTLRAFLSGRLDLTQAEAVLGIIDAESSAGLKTALHQLAGNVSLPLSAVRLLLFETLAQLEASLDFADEEIPAIPAEYLQQTLSEAADSIAQLLHQIAFRQIGGNRPKIVLAGLPNAGKSTLFNKLLQREAALVSPLAGTTRDYLEADMDWAGIPITLIDTAGLSEFTQNEWDEAAQNAAYDLCQQADVIIHCYETADLSLCLKGQTGGAFDSKTVSFQTKRADEDLEDLMASVASVLRRSSDRTLLPNTALRCQEALFAAAASLDRAKGLTDLSLTALELRGAVNQLGLVDGTVHTEDILERIFSRFCIGK